MKSKFFIICLMMARSGGFAIMSGRKIANPTERRKTKSAMDC